MSETATPFPNVLDRLRAERLRTHRPLKASIELTYRCNERCTHCYLDDYRDDPKRKLSLEQWRQVLRELKRGGVLYLDLMGGEAMLHPHFWEIADYCVELGFETAMITNGLKITPESARRLHEIGFSAVTLSLYSLDSEIHDRMTQVKGSHAKTLAAISALREAGVYVTLNCLLTRENIERYFELEDWCQESGISLRPDPNITPTFARDLSPIRQRASREQLLAFYRTRATRDARRVPRPQLNEPDDYVCGAGKLKCAVTAYGELLVCLDVREPLGLLTENAFEALWDEHPVAQRWRAFKVAEVKGRPEGRSGSFCEHCPASAKLECGDPLRVPGFSAQLAEVQHQVYEERNAKEARHEG